MDVNLVYNFAVWVVPILMAITLHEAGHAWAASKCGDQTSRMLGRVTLNPVPHIDPIGTILLPLVLFLTTPIIFGWAKPVPVISRNLKKPKRDMALIALAGPGANFLMVLIWLMVFKICSESSDSPMIQGFAYMGLAGVFINLLLGIFNLIPFPPLDGGRIVNSLLPAKYAVPFAKIEPYGIFIVLGLFFFAGLDHLIMSILITAEVFLLKLVGVENAGMALQLFFQRFF